MNSLCYLLFLALSSTVVAVAKEEIIQVISKFEPVLSQQESHEADYEIQIKNTTKKDIKIKAILSGCSCLKIKSFPNKINAGQSSKFNVKVSEKRVGLIDIPFYVFQEGVKQPTIINQPLLILPPDGIFFPKKVIYIKNNNHAFVQILGTNDAISKLTYSCSHPKVSGKPIIKKQFAMSNNVQSLIYRFTIPETTNKNEFANLYFKSRNFSKNIIIRWSKN